MLWNDKKIKNLKFVFVCSSVQYIWIYLIVKQNLEVEKEEMHNLSQKFP